jgi:1-acyl-sn-glycerol-3-phosphate acyltransferase
MLHSARQWLIERGLTPFEIERIENAVQVNSAGFDDWGLDPETIKVSLVALRWFYRSYFRVETVGIEKVPQGRVILAANHGGQVPVDGLLIALSLMLDADPGRIVRAMMERWVPSLPFVSTFFSRTGQVVGDHRNCRDLLEHEQAVLVFPEGVRGSGKTVFQRYKLQSFGTGFVRLALETRAPIIPVAVIGCEEAIPSILNFKPLAKLIGAPYFPITPLFPFLGPIGALPLPTKVTIRFGDPICFEEDPDAPDSVANELVGKVKRTIESEIAIGLKQRGHKLFTGGKLK